MRTVLVMLCLIFQSGCAYWHWWRGDEVERRAVDEVNLSFNRKP